MFLRELKETVIHSILSCEDFAERFCADCVFSDEICSESELLGWPECERRGCWGVIEEQVGELVQTVYTYSENREED